MPHLLILSGIIALGAFAFDKVGEGVNEASNGVVKLALVAGGLYLVGKKMKVI